MLTTLLLAKATHIPIYHAAFTLQNACMYAGTHPLRQSRLACSWSKSLLAWVLSMYEPSVVGKFCKARDPYLAYIAYAKGLCDDELISITNDNSMFKQQARYLIKRRQPDLRSSFRTIFTVVLLSTRHVAYKFGKLETNVALDRFNCDSRMH